MYGDIAAELRERIETGQIPPSAPVGTLRSLAEDFGVAKGTVERALAQLRDENWVYSRTGSGVFALGPEARRQADDTIAADLARQLTEIREMLLGIRADLDRQLRDTGEFDGRLTDVEGHIEDLYRRGGFTQPEDMKDEAAARQAGGAR